jgi:hypothetical protein
MDMDRKKRLKSSNITQFHLTFSYFFDKVISKSKNENISGNPNTSLKTNEENIKIKILTIYFGVVYCTCEVINKPFIFTSKLKNKSVCYIITSIAHASRPR